MSALTAEVRSAKSPVARWLRSTFPHHQDAQADYRKAAGRVATTFRQRTPVNATRRVPHMLSVRSGR